MTDVVDAPGVAAAPAAGWYADPVGAADLRWWDGTRWTTDTRVRPRLASEAVRPAAVSPVGQVAPVVAVASSNETPATVEASPITPLVPEVVPWAAAPGQVLHSSIVPNHGLDGGVSAASVYDPSAPAIGSPQTAGIWLLASTPTMASVTFLLLGIVSMVVGLTSAPPALLAWLILAPAAWAFAYFDSRALAARGYRRPNILWMLATPLAYLIVRGRRVREGGERAWPPELVYFLQIALNLLTYLALTALAALGLSDPGTGSASSGGHPPNAHGPMMPVGSVTDYPDAPLARAAEQLIVDDIARTDTGNWVVDCSAEESRMTLQSEVPCVVADPGSGAAASIYVVINADGSVEYAWAD